MCAVPLALATHSRSDGPHAAAAHPNLTKSFEHPNQGSRDTSPPTIEEWAKVQAWMKENCRNRFDFFQAMSDKNAQKERAKQLIVERYRQIDRVAFPRLKEAMVQEARAQDKIFGAQVKLRLARKHDEPSKEKARADLRDAVGNLIDAELAVKHARIARLQDEITDLSNNRDEILKKWSKGMTELASPETQSDSESSLNSGATQ
jgi:hypothetical protein